MRTFFNYCFYRYAKFYKEWGDNGRYLLTPWFYRICHPKVINISIFNAKY